MTQEVRMSGEDTQIAPATARGRRRRQGPGRVARLTLPVVLPLVVVVIWEYVGQRGLIANGLFPSASKSVLALVDWVTGTGSVQSLYSGTWLQNAWASILRILSGYAIGGALGVMFGMFAGISTVMRRLIDPTVNALRPVSVTAWIPLALILFGIGAAPAIFLTSLATFFPVYINTLSGVRYADGRLVRAARMLGADRRQVLTRVILPAALPSIAVGLRIGVAVAWTTVVVAEILGAKSGLGYVLIDSYNQFRFDYIIACMFSIGALGFLTDKLIEILFERRLKWVIRGGQI
ncbi:ABC transporter permease [Microtetraspora malaysiensis]|uniref:ABC transporter permease n=1 Tax=Microtetraspora malaysiensis TaxID=161358 RepID=A0ABW6SQ66_9ACTN